MPNAKSNPNSEPEWVLYMESCFSKVPLAPADPILGLTVAFLEDERKDKVNLGVGLYKNEALETPILACVKEAQKSVLEKQRSKEYLPIWGLGLLIEKMGELVFGVHLWEKEKGRIAGFQSIGGTGALRIGAKLLKKECEGPVFISEETWANHRGIFTDSALSISAYPYYDHEKGSLKFDAMISSLEKAPKGSLFLFHACCHNPTGVDLTQAEWEKVAALCQKKGCIPFLDFAYQGFGRSIEEDAFAVRLFLKKGISFLVASSCSKNFGLYGERVGCLFIVTQNAKESEHVHSRVRQCIRTEYSTPPLHGASIVAHILSDAKLKILWGKEVDEMRHRIHRVKVQFAERLQEKTSKRDYRYLKQGHGMFAFCGLGKSQTEVLQKQHAIYMMSDGRVNVCGLNEANLDRVVNAIAAVL